MSWRIAVILALATLAVHGLLLVNDGVYWDGHLIYSYVHDRNWTELSTMFRDLGAPQTALLYWVLGSVGDVFLFKLLSFTGILAATLSIWRLGVESRRVTDEEAIWIAALAMAYPAFRAGVEIVMAPSLIAYGCFFIAAWIDYRAVRRGSAALHAIAAPLFVVSFSLPSLMALFLGYVVFAAGTSRTRWIDRASWGVVLLAAGAARWLMRPGGDYAGYNQISLSLFSAITELGWFLRYAVYVATNRALAGLLAQPFFAVAALLAAYAVFATSRGAQRDTPRAGGWTLGFAILLFGLAVGPYAVVGKHPLPDGWTTRHALLIGLPVALAIVAGASMLDRAWRLKPYVRQLALTAVLVAFGTSLFDSYLSWQARWVKERSVLALLAATPGADKYSVFVIDDRFPEGGELTYRTYEWPALFRRIWPDHARAAVFGDIPPGDIVRALTPLRSARFNLADVDLWGCEATLLIRRGRLGSDDFTMTLTYTYTRLFRPERIPNYLVQVAAIELTPRPFERPDREATRAECGKP